MLMDIHNFLDANTPWIDFFGFFFLIAFFSVFPFLFLGEMLVKFSPRDRYYSAVARKEKCERMAGISLCIFMIPALPMAVLFLLLLLILISIMALCSVLKESFDNYLWKNRYKSMLPNWMANLIYGKKYTE